MPRSGRTPLYLLVALTALAAALRFPALGQQSFSPDEGVTLSLLHRSLGGMLSTIPHSESTPPLYYLLARAWTWLFGDSEAGIRSLSALAGTLTIPVAYAAAAALTKSARAGLVAAALAATSPLLVFYSQESRSYALLVLLAGLTLYAFARALDDPRPRALGLWAAVAAVALLTHYFAAFVVVPQAAWLVWRAPAGRRAVLIACAAVAAVGAALLPLALAQRATGHTSFIADIPLGQRLKELPKKFLIGEQATPGDYGPLAEALKFPAGLLALVAVGLLVARADARERAGGAAAAALAAGGLALPLVLTAVGIDYLAAYNLQALWIPAGVVVAAGFGARRAGRAGPALAAALAAIGVAVVVEVAADPQLQRYDFRGAARRIGPGERAIVVTPAGGRGPLAAYLPGTRQLPFGARVREVVLLGMYARDGSGRSRVAGGRPAPPIPGFTRVVQRIDTRTYTLIRLRAPAPRPVDPVLLRTRGLGSAETTALLEP